MSIDSFKLEQYCKPILCQSFAVWPTADHIDYHNQSPLNFLLPLSDNYLISVWEALAICFWVSN